MKIRKFQKLLEKDKVPIKFYQNIELGHEFIVPILADVLGCSNITRNKREEKAKVRIDEFLTAYSIKAYNSEPMSPEERHERIKVSIDSIDLYYIALFLNRFFKADEDKEYMFCQEAHDLYNRILKILKTEYKIVFNKEIEE